MTAFDQMIKVRIVQPGMTNYTGYIRGHRFVEGESYEKIPVRVALLIGASCLVEDEEGRQLNPNTYAFDGVAEVSADDVEPATQSAQKDVVEEVVDDMVDFAEPGEELVDAKQWRPEDLEAIADAEGINGLREIGEEFGVKDRSIDGLIAQILKAQSGTDKLAGEE